jgi:putative DNA methylase
MREASTVVAQYQMTRLTDGRLGVGDVDAEAGIALTLCSESTAPDGCPLTMRISLSKSLNIRLDNRSGGYKNDGHMIGINAESSLVLAARTSRKATMHRWSARAQS